MTLRINTNAASLNSQRQLGIQNASLNHSLERLSTGARINRAGDDAAGLAISETMKAQVRGMQQAAANSQDAVNLVQTAEGGLEETSNILNRLRELAVQASNDTNQQSDRSKIQTEIGQLTEELNRISVNTIFNNRSLLDGSISQTRGEVNASVSVANNPRVGQVNGSGIPQFGDMLAGVTLTNPTAATADASLSMKLVATATAGVFNLEVTGSDGLVSVINDVTNTTGAGTNLFSGGVSRTFTLNAGSGAGVKVTFGNVPPTVTDVSDVAILQVNARHDAVTVDAALTFQLGTFEGQSSKFGIADTRATALHLESISVIGSTDEASRAQAQSLIGVVDKAMQTINIERARLGGFQNRVEHDLANLGVASENLSESNSRIRDVDVASETANLTRSQILVQASTSLLAQANATPQNALTLLRG